MKTNIRIFLLCSVPEDQKPIQEYLAFQENSFFNWITLTKKEYQKTIFFFFLRFFPVVLFLRFLFTPLPIFHPSFLHGGQFFPQVLEGISTLKGFEILDVLGETIFWTSLGVCFFLGLLFFRCREIYLHFFEPRLVYEEASWYDGQIWEKPFALLKSDRLISTQRLQPILKRLRGTLAFFLIAEVVFFFSLW